MRGDWTRGRLSIAHLTLLGVLVAAAVGCGGGGAAQPRTQVHEKGL